MNRLFMIPATVSVKESFKANLLAHDFELCLAASVEGPLAGPVAADSAFGIYYLVRADQMSEDVFTAHCAGFPMCRAMVIVCPSERLALYKKIVKDRGPFCRIVIPPFGDDDLVHALCQLRRHCQLLREQDKLRIELQAKQRMIGVYRELTKTLTSMLNVSNVLQKVWEKNARLLDCQALSIYLNNEEKLRLEYMETGKKNHIKPKKLVFNLGQGVPGKVFERGKPMILKTPFNPETVELLRDHYPMPIHGLIAVPLDFRDRILGVVEAINKNGQQSFHDGDLVILQMLADHAAVALENASLFERVEKLTIIDDLTQVYNFRFFNQMLVHEFKRAERSLTPLSLLFLDLDGFKMVNDVHGHLVGNIVLKDVANLLMTTVRKIDIVARFGGDEFTIILPNTGYDGAERVAKRILNNIETYRYRSRNTDIQLSVSIGISSFPDHVQTKDQLLKVADKAMYRIKENRRRDMPIGTLSAEDLERLHRNSR